MNNELVKLHEWLCLNRLSLNISKTNFIIFHSLRKPVNSVVTLLINKQAIEEVEYVKYLGVLLDAKLTFNYHINILSKKISRAVGVLYKLRPFVTPRILTSVYYAIAYPFLLYGITIWGNANNTLIRPLHILQKKIVRMITNNDTFPDVPGPLAHSPPLFQQLKIVTIYDIFKIQVAKFVFESINDLGPAQSVIKYNLASDIHHHGTRYKERGNFHKNYSRTVKYGSKAIKNRGIVIWDSLPARECRSKKSLITNYKKLLLEEYI